MTVNADKLVHTFLRNRDVQDISKDVFDYTVLGLKIPWIKDATLLRSELERSFTESTFTQHESEPPASSQLEMGCFSFLRCGMGI